MSGLFRSPKFQAQQITPVDEEEVRKKQEKVERRRQQSATALLSRQQSLGATLLRAPGLKL
jgi:hypothetical protein